MIRSMLRNTAINLPEPNTFIGGVGASTITSASDLAVLMDSLDVGNILHFNVDPDNNVRCFVDGDTYTSSTSGLFVSNANITAYIDLDGLYISAVGNQWRSDANLKMIYFPSMTVIGDGGGFSSWNTCPFKYVHFPNLATIRNTVFNSVSQCKFLYLPSLVNILPQSAARSCMSSMSVLERLYIPNATTINWFYSNNAVFNNIKTGCIIYCHPSLETSSLAHTTVTVLVAATIGDTITINGLVYTCVAIKTNNTEFISGINVSQTAGNLAASINADTRTGTIGDVQAFSSSNLIGLVNTLNNISANGTTISTTSPSTFTVTSFGGYGGRNGAIAYAEDVRSCDIRYVDDFTLPDAPTGLSYSNLTTDTVDLNFTAPTPNVNGTDGYEVWIDDGTFYRKLFRYDEIAASGDTLDLAEILADVGSLSGIKIKIRTFDGFYNLSPFSNEITLP